MSQYLLDTCAWIDAILSPELLSPKVRKIIEQASPIHLATFSVLELARKEALGKIILKMPCEEWLETVALPPGKIKLLPMTPSIAIDSTRLPGAFLNKQGQPHKDPADRVITATARHHGLTLLTSDQILLDYSHVPTLKSRK